MSEILFAPDWWMLGLGVASAVALFFYANNRLDKKLRLISLVALLAVVGWGLLARFVETPVEAARKGTSRFIQAAVERDTRTMDELLSVAVALGRFGKPDILATTPGYADQWGLKSAYMTGTEVEARGSQVTARIRVLSTHEGGRTQVDTLPTDWEFVWAKEPEGYRIVEIIPLRIGTTDVRQVVENYFSRPR